MKRRVKEGENGWSTLYMYEYGTMKPVKVISRRERRGRLMIWTKLGYNTYGNPKWNPYATIIY
jgi:hypothetical protein